MVTRLIVLLALCAALTVQTGATMRYLGEAAQSLYAPARYVDEVLTGR